MSDQPQVISTVNIDNKWVTDKAWISGVAGAIAVLACAAWYNITGSLTSGVVLFGWQVTNTQVDSILFALALIASTMVLTEMVRLWAWNSQFRLHIHPAIRSKHYWRFAAEAVGNYFFYLVLFGIITLFFHSAGEYGYLNKNTYYQGWFRFLELAFNTYLWAGLPYVLLTRGLKHDSQADQRDYGFFLHKVVAYPFKLVFEPKKNRQHYFDDIDKKVIRGLLVKLFFTPLMTVFFISQFPHLVNNIGYVVDGLPSAIANGSYTLRRFNMDLFNISIAFIFSIDVALAWCGYVVSSRWVDNQTASAEPTMLGWMVCIICYPPFQNFLGLYYSAPAERDILNFGNPIFVTLFTTMMVLSYLVYMSATLWFGVRFSNLTNRGIIRKGPFAVVRHPAYASKNFAWWCVMFPVVLYNAANTGLTIAVIQILGLLLMSWVYYLRALTEEKHLSADPCYRDYCQQVKYRFIPGVI